jgi:MFS family permease
MVDCSRNDSLVRRILLVYSFWLWLADAIVPGVGTALVYPTLLAAVGDVVHHSYRAAAVGIYRLWRDGGYAVGDILVEVISESPGRLVLCRC